LAHLSQLQPVLALYKCTKRKKLILLKTNMVCTMLAVYHININLLVAEIAGKTNSEFWGGNTNG